MRVAVEVKNATSQLDAVGVYAGGTYRLIPAPLVTIAKNYEKTGGDIRKKFMNSMILLLIMKNLLIKCQNINEYITKHS